MVEGACWSVRLRRSMAAGGGLLLLLLLLSLSLHCGRCGCVGVWCGGRVQTDPADRSVNSHSRWFSAKTPPKSGVLAANQLAPKDPRSRSPENPESQFTDKSPGVESNEKFVLALLRGESRQTVVKNKCRDYNTAKYAVQYFTYYCLDILYFRHPKLQTRTRRPLYHTTSSPVMLEVHSYMCWSISLLSLSAKRLAVLFCLLVGYTNFDCCDGPMPANCRNPQVACEDGALYVCRRRIFFANLRRTHTDLPYMAC